MNRATEDLNLWGGARLIPFRDHKINAIEIALHDLMQGDVVVGVADNPKPTGGGECHDIRAGLFMSPGVFTGFVHVEFMDMVLDRPDSDMPGPERRDEFLQEGGLAAVGLADDGDDGGHDLLSAWWPSHGTAT